MSNEIIRDQFFLQLESKLASEEDVPIGNQLRITLEENRETCAGLAANMIGSLARIIAFFDNGEIVVMYNPEIVKFEGVYYTEEGCLSLDGTRRTKRFKKIKVKYQNENFQMRYKTYEGWTAQVVQHEIDHCNGIII